MIMLKICETCANSAWRDGKSAVTEVCLACTFGEDKQPTNWKLKPMTNADRIRAMSDEELAVFVRAVIMAEDCPATGCDCDKCFFKEPCFNGSKWHGKETEWLKQPAGQ